MGWEKVRSTTVAHMLYTYNSLSCTFKPIYRVKHNRLKPTVTLVHQSRQWRQCTSCIIIVYQTSQVKRKPFTRCYRKLVSYISARTGSFKQDKKAMDIYLSVYFIVLYSLSFSGKHHFMHISNGTISIFFYHKWLRIAYIKLSFRGLIVPYQSETCDKLNSVNCK